MNLQWELRKDLGGVDEGSGGFRRAFPPPVRPDAGGVAVRAGGSVAPGGEVEEAEEREECDGEESGDTAESWRDALDDGDEVHDCKHEGNEVVVEEKGAGDQEEREIGN